MTCVTGDETGLIKFWDIRKSNGASLLYSFGEQNRNKSIMGMCWLDRNTSSVMFSTKEGFITLFDVGKKIVLASKDVGSMAALPNAIAFLKEKTVMITKDGSMLISDCNLQTLTVCKGNGIVDAVHIHRKYGMIAMGGNENNLCVYDLASEDISLPVFKARNISNNILDVPSPIFITGTCIINPFVFCACSAYHNVRFYDRRSSERPVQEFEISREIERRPTTMLQWNANKFIIGEASGDVHLYDTRRGFSSRAKLRGGVGSVRCMTKHPAGHQILGVTGLDRKARLYHVPTGKLLLSIYTVQRVNCILLDKELPLSDNVFSYNGIFNPKQPDKANMLGDDLWDDMDPVDDFDDSVVQVIRKAHRKRSR